MFKKRVRIVASDRKRQTRYVHRSHEFGIELPKTVEQALSMDANGSTLWTNVIKELQSDKVAFEILSDETKAHIGYQLMNCHMVFYIKIMDFKCKARLVAGSYVTEAPATIIFASVLSRERVRMALMVATLNDLEVKSAGILNACVCGLH